MFLLYRWPAVTPWASAAPAQLQTLPEHCGIWIADFDAVITWMQGGWKPRLNTTRHWFRFTSRALLNATCCLGRLARSRTLSFLAPRRCSEPPRGARTIIMAHNWGRISKTGLWMQRRLSFHAPRRWPVFPLHWDNTSSHYAVALGADFVGEPA